MTLIPVSVASANEGFTHSNRVNNSTLYSWACVYNTPSSTFNTIKVRGVRADVGDVTTLSVYSTGAIPDDPATSEDDDKFDRYLRSSLLVTSAQHTQTSSVDSNVYFSFPTDLSQANLGVSFTVVQDTADSSGNRVATSEYRFSSLSSLSHYQSPNNNTSSSHADGGAGNVYYQTTHTGGAWSSYSNDPPLAFELYYEPRTPFGTVRGITGNLTSPITNSIT